MVMVTRPGKEPIVVADYRNAGDDVRAEQGFTRSIDSLSDQYIIDHYGFENLLRIRNGTHGNGPIRLENNVRRRDTGPYRRPTPPPAAAPAPAPAPAPTPPAPSMPASKCGYCLKEGAAVSNCACEHAVLYRQLRCKGGARKNPPARLAELADAAGIRHPPQSS